MTNRDDDGVRNEAILVDAPPIAFSSAYEAACVREYLLLIYSR